MLIVFFFFVSFRFEPQQGLVHESSVTAAEIAHAVQSGAGSSTASADVALQNAYKNLQEKLADMVRNVKQVSRNIRFFS